MVGTFLKAGGNAAGQKLSTITDLPDCESDTNKGSMSWCSESSWPFYYTDSACWQTSACWCPPTSACWPTPVYQQSQHRPSPCYAVTGVHFTGYRGSRAAYLDGDWFKCQPDWPTSHCLPSRENGAVWPRSGFDFSLHWPSSFRDANLQRDNERGISICPTWIQPLQRLMTSPLQGQNCNQLERFQSTCRGLSGVVVRVLTFNLWSHRFKSQPGYFMLESW